jgi:hypothetical protein
MEKHIYPTTTLSNGLRVANFSSSHEFHFVDGSVLPACSPERATWLMMVPVEVVAPSPCGRWTDIVISFELSSQCLAQLMIIEDDPDVDLVIAPRIVKDAAANLGVKLTKVRTNRVSDRVKKLSHIDRFCV